MRIAKVSGIPIEIHPTWFIIFFLILLSLVDDFTRQFPDHSLWIHRIAGLAATILFFLSVLLHELSHSLMATRMGHRVRSITLFVFGGISEIEEEAHTPSSEFWIAIVGPLSSLILAFLFAAISWVAGDATGEFASVFHKLGWINVVLAIFNLVPAFPLDGGRVLRSILWKAKNDLTRATITSAKVSQLFAYGLIIFGVLIALAGGPFINGLWTILIGWFLLNSAESSVKQLHLKQALHGLRAVDILSVDFPAVSRSVTLKELVEHHIFPTGNRCFLVSENGVLRGLVSIHEIKRIPQLEWATTTVGEVMKKVEELLVVAPDTEVLRILRTMDDRKINQLPVVQDGRLEGLITREKLLNVIRSRLSLGS